MAARQDAAGNPAPVRSSNVLELRLSSFLIELPKMTAPKQEEQHRRAARRACAPACAQQTSTGSSRRPSCLRTRAALSGAGRQAPAGVPVWHAKQLRDSQHQGLTCRQVRVMACRCCGVDGRIACQHPGGRILLHVAPALSPLLFQVLSSAGIRLMLPLWSLLTLSCLAAPRA